MTWLLDNVNLVLVLAGFLAFERGIARAWSSAAAWIVGGAVLMVAGSWPYLTRSRKTRA